MEEELLQSWVLFIREGTVEASEKIPCLGIKVREVAFLCSLCLDDRVRSEPTDFSFTFLKLRISYLLNLLLEWDGHTQTLVQIMTVEMPQLVREIA